VILRSSATERGQGASHRQQRAIDAFRERPKAESMTIAERIRRNHTSTMRCLWTVLQRCFTTANGPIKHNERFGLDVLTRLSVAHVGFERVPHGNARYVSLRQ